jgi:hypothetical protein
VNDFILEDIIANARESISSLLFFLSNVLQHNFCGSWVLSSKSLCDTRKCACTSSIRRCAKYNQGQVPGAEHNEAALVFHEQPLLIACMKTGKRTL